MTLLMGAYSTTIDTSKASQTDYFVGWVEIADSAGHIMADGGSVSQPMFNVQLNTNGAPSLGAPRSVGLTVWIRLGSIPRKPTRFEFPYGNRTVSMTSQKSPWNLQPTRRSPQPFIGTKPRASVPHPTFTLKWKRANWFPLTPTTCFRGTESSSFDLPSSGATIRTSRW